MPYAYRKIRGKNAYKVFNKVSGVIHSNSTSLENAKKQIRLLNAIENNPNFKPKKGGMMGEDEDDDELADIFDNMNITEEDNRPRPTAPLPKPKTTIIRRPDLPVVEVPPVEEDPKKRSKPQGGEPTKKKEGKGLEVKNIQLLLKNSYKIPPDPKVGEFNLDKALSGRRVQVYTRANSKQVVVVHRGTQGTKDWATDLYYATGGDTSTTRRFQHALEVQKKAEAKYGANNITSLGHSLGSLVNSTVAQNSKEIINLNKAVSPLDAVKKTSDKEINIRTSGDPVSALLPIRQQNKRTITIPSKTYNPLTEHSTDTLKRLPPNKIIGAGLSPQELDAVIFSSPFGALLLKVLYEYYFDRENPAQVAPAPVVPQQEESKDERDIEMGEGMCGCASRQIKGSGSGASKIVPSDTREYEVMMEEEAKQREIVENERILEGLKTLFNSVLQSNETTRKELLETLNLIKLGDTLIGIENNIQAKPYLDTQLARDTLELADDFMNIAYGNPFINITDARISPETEGEGIKEDLAKKISPPNKKMSGKINPWVEYVKSFAKGKGINYASAMKHPDLKKGYKKGGMIAEDGGDGGDRGDAPKKVGVNQPNIKRRKLKTEEKRQIITYLQRRIQGMPFTLGDFGDRLIDAIRSQLDDDIITYTNEAENKKEVSRLVASYLDGMRALIDEDNTDIIDGIEDMKEGKGMSRINRPVAIRGRGMPTSREAVIAEGYNETQLGAQGGKKYVSL